ncbi:hypothetical protein VNI00_014895 [Paramarasmius palmivorus]|uniref:Uncharacterized protein n=1 Tax=Paramarasmius palmivorus TaxID=297713 RepID=A0AAW0BP32_9AGAR
MVSSSFRSGKPFSSNTDESSDDVVSQRLVPLLASNLLSEADFEDSSSNDYKDGSDHDVRPSKKAKTSRDAPTKAEVSLVSAPSTSSGPRTKSVSKGKSKAVESDTIEIEDDDDDDKAEPYPAHPVSIDNVDLEVLVEAGKRGVGPREDPLIIDRLNNMLGRREHVKTLKKLNYMLHVNSDADLSLVRVLTALTAQPLLLIVSFFPTGRPPKRENTLHSVRQPQTEVQACSRCEHQWDYIKSKVQGFGKGLTSPMGLLFQANSILESMREFDMLNDQISSLLRLRDEIEVCLKDRQQLLHESGSADPRILLKHLFWENNFTASDSKSSSDPLTCSMDDLRVLVKNTTIDITGLNSKEYHLDRLDMFMPPNSHVLQKFVERIIENPISTPLWSLPSVNPAPHVEDKVVGPSKRSALVDHDSDHEMDPPTAASGSKGGEITVEVVPPTPEPMVVDSPAVKVGAEKTVPAPSHSSGLAQPTLYGFCKGGR